MKWLRNCHEIAGVVMLPIARSGLVALSEVSKFLSMYVFHRQRAIIVHVLCIDDLLPDLDQTISHPAMSPLQNRLEGASACV